MEKSPNNSQAKVYWTIVRTLGFCIVGIFNTILIKQEEIGTWKNYLGYGLLIIAILDALGLGRKLLTRQKQPHEK